MRTRLLTAAILTGLLSAGCQASLYAPAPGWTTPPGPTESPGAPPAPPDAPPQPPGTGAVGSPAQEHNLRGINAYRQRLGLRPVVLDAGLSAFALEGSRALMRERRAHGNFRRAARSGALFRVHGFTGHACENQGDPNGWPQAASVEAQIDDILQAMWREGPGGGHYDNLANPRLRRVGIGLLVTADGLLYLTNDFSE